MGRDDGGPAFPGGELPEHPNRPVGMCLRDWFAGQALAGIASNPYWTDKTWQTIAADSYAAADALLSARKVPT